MARHRQGMGWGKFKRKKRWGIDPDVAQAISNIDRRKAGLDPIPLADRSLHEQLAEINEVLDEPEKKEEVPEAEVGRG